MSSCFLLTIEEDSLYGIYRTLKDCALISQSAGGIGISIHKIRASGSYIRGTNGYSNGIVPMLKVFNDTARYVDQGGGKRKGSIAVYLVNNSLFSSLKVLRNLGMLILSNFCSLKRTMERRNSVQEIFSMGYGFLTSSWKELNRMVFGLSCAQVSAQVCLMFTEINLTNSMLNMRRKEEVERQCKPENYGVISFNHKSKQGLLTCSTRINAIRNQIRNILGLSDHQISALKSLSILLQMK